MIEIKFSNGINQDGILYVPYSEVKEQAKQIRADAIEEYKKALQEVIDRESCVHGIDLKIEADKLIYGF